MSLSESAELATKESWQIEEKDLYEDPAEKNFQLKSPKFWAIIMGVYLTIFIVALVRQAHRHTSRKFTETRDRTE